MTQVRTSVSFLIFYQQCINLFYIARSASSLSEAVEKASISFHFSPYCF